MSDAWTSAARARRDFADLIDSLTPEQVDGTTLCDGWTPHTVLGHVVTFLEVPLPKFFFNIAKAKGNFDVAADEMARTLAERPVAELTAALRAKADKKGLPGFPAELTTVDCIAHGQDIRRGLGLDDAPDADHVREALDFATTHKRANIMLEHKGLLDGLRFESTDTDWSHGEGDLVSGTNEALLMGMLRRPVFDELTGDGVATLQARQQD